MQALKEKGYLIPEDISVIGFDDVTSCEIFVPPLTTLRANKYDIGKIAVNRLIQKISIECCTTIPGI
jgi:LacI family transcriptional regulator